MQHYRFEGSWVSSLGGSGCGRGRLCGGSGLLRGRLGSNGVSRNSDDRVSRGLGDGDGGYSGLLGRGLSGRDYSTGGEDLRLYISISINGNGQNVSCLAYQEFREFRGLLTARARALRKKLFTDCL